MLKQFIRPVDSFISAEREEKEMKWCSIFAHAGWMGGSALGQGWATVPRSPVEGNKLVLWCEPCKLLGERGLILVFHGICVPQA